MLIIQDMERPRPQLFTISQEPLVDVARRISSAPSFAGFR
jgi:hypothetical protein